MAPGKPAIDFNDIINADRQRRKNEALAQEIFSKGRRSSAPGAGVIHRKPGTGPSLASRVGVAKRNVSTAAKPMQKPIRSTGTAGTAGTGNVDAEWTHDLHSLNNPTASRVSQLPNRGPKVSHANRNDRLYSALHGSASSPGLNNQFNIVGAAKPSISIRGLAGPYTVMAKNFALGTTAADIESVMTLVGGVAQSCRIVTERPKVIAEIIFESKEGADNVVGTFNNQNADGNLLHVYHKIRPTSPAVKLLSTQSAPVKPVARSVTPTGPRADTFTDRSDDARSGSDRYAPRDRREERGRDFDRDEVMDGSYGFEDCMDTDDRSDNRDNGRGRGGLYSDIIIGSRGRGRGNSRDRGDKARGYDRSRGYR